MRAPFDSNRLKKQSFPYLLLLPAIIFLLMFSLYPFLSGIGYSFTSTGYINDEVKLVGLSNYRQILSGNIGVARFFKLALVQSFEWTVLVIAGQFIMAMGTALLLNEKFPGRAVFRIAILVPIAMPTVILALTWQWMYDPFYGLINHYLVQAGILSQAKIWVGQSNSTIWPLIVVAIWRGFPFMALMLLSGLQSIPAEYYEAAKVDGGNALARFRHITLPMMRTTITITLILNTLWWWNHFDIILIVGSGGAQFAYGAVTLPILAWFEAFRWNHLARGAAISVMSMVLLGGLIIWNARRELRSVSET
jgi:multiple sugar transport system permease protein